MELVRWFVICDPGKPLMQQDGGVYSLYWVHRQPCKTQHPGLGAMEESYRTKYQKKHNDTP